MWPLVFPFLEEKSGIDLLFFGCLAQDLEIQDVLLAALLFLLPEGMDWVK